MKSLRLFLTLSILPSFACVARATTAEFPGLKAIMSESAWQSAKLDRLDAADLKLINEAFAQYLQANAHAAAAAQTTAATPSPDSAAAQPATPDQKRSLWARFGLGAAPSSEKEKSKERPVMLAKVLAWQGSNGFRLDNGQVWNGIDPIREELVGREIGITEGRFGSYLLVLDGETTTIRLHRVK